ncbi:MAG: peptidase T [Planctomycetes bacterium]|nr:peptidase T [Planctomycetota bacterium]
METLLDRFSRYVKVETTAVEQTDKYPSSPGQLELGRMLRDELTALGLTDAEQDENGIVWATIPGNVPNAPTIAWISHVDTSPEFTAHGVKPVIHKNWDGKDIVLPGDKSRVIRVTDVHGMDGLKGKTIITSDGTTLLGADDKSGVAVIMTATEKLMSQRDIKHGPIRVIFTCDEEVGRGVDKIDLKKVGAVCGYTCDGETIGELDNETFSADLAVVTITGRNIHPGLATGKMINAIRIAGEFIARMPWQKLSPENTSGRDPFLHPYVIEGGVEQVKIRIILRSFETEVLARHAEVLRAIAASLQPEHPNGKFDIAVTKQYRNMRDWMAKEPRAVELAAKAIQAVGLTPKFQSVRGGTDGSRLTEMGLPTPNLAVGMHNFHSPLEFACLEEMETSVKILIELAQLWGKEK